MNSIAIIGLLSKIPGLNNLVSWVTRKFDQPKLTIRLELDNRGKRWDEPAISYKNRFPDNVTLNFGEINSSVIFNYILRYEYAMKITNNSQYAAYDIKLVEPKSENLTVFIEPRIDYTLPFLAHDRKEFVFYITLKFVGTSPEADKMLKRLPFDSLQLHYKNGSGTEFATDFFPNDGEIERLNQFRKI